MLSLKFYFNAYLYKSKDHNNTVIELILYNMAFYITRHTFTQNIYIHPHTIYTFMHTHTYIYLYIYLFIYIYFKLSSLYNSRNIQYAEILTRKVDEDGKITGSECRVKCEKRWENVRKRRKRVKWKR